MVKARVRGAAPGMAGVRGRSPRHGRGVWGGGRSPPALRGPSGRPARSIYFVQDATARIAQGPRPPERKPAHGQARKSSTHRSLQVKQRRRTKRQRDAVRQEQHRKRGVEIPPCLKWNKTCIYSDEKTKQKIFYKNKEYKMI